MREDCGILVINLNGRLLAANSIAELLLGRPLPPNMVLDINATSRDPMTKKE